MKMYIKNLATLLFLSLFVAGCSITHGPQQTGIEAPNGTVEDWKSDAEAIARGGNQVLPKINNINTCPEGMSRVNHEAGGDASSRVKATEKGTTYTTTAGGSQGHDCK